VPTCCCRLLNSVLSLRRCTLHVQPHQGQDRGGPACTYMLVLIFDVDCCCRRMIDDVDQLALL
jgi:hypothetical protein